MVINIGMRREERHLKIRMAADEITKEQIDKEKKEKKEKEMEELKEKDKEELNDKDKDLKMLEIEKLLKADGTDC